MSPIFLACRPKTLTASIAPVIVGNALAYRLTHQIYWSTAVLALICAVLLQVASNFFNDAIDADKGADTAERLGPTRVTQAGLLSKSTVLKFGLSAVIIAIMCGVPLVIQGGMPVLLIGLSAAFFSWCYTGGPYPLAYHGLGEVFVLIYYGIAAVSGTLFLQVGFLDPAAVFWGALIGSFGMALISLNNFRDIAADKLVHKKTIAVRIGQQNAKKIVLFFLTCPFLAPLFFVQTRTVGFYGAVLPAFLLASIAGKKIWAVTPSRAVNPLLGLISGTQLVYATAVAVWMTR